MSQLPYAYGLPPVAGQLRSQNSDFRVVEALGFTPSGQGEHVFLRIEKNGVNTEWVATQLANFAGLKGFQVGFAGLKDRHAITQQWFSVHLPKQVDIDWQDCFESDVNILEVTRHDKKLRRGVLSGNQFTLCLRQIAGDRTKLEQRLEAISLTGVPNYFGPQRFGLNGNNIAKAESMFAGHVRASRAKRSIYLSAIRSWLFNLCLAERIQQGCWNQVLAGDVLQLQGSKSFFYCDAVDAELRQRVTAFDIFPTGPLAGKGELLTRHEVLELEQTVFDHFPTWLQGLAQAGLTQERRVLGIPVRQLNWRLTEDVLQLDFFLPAGSYATSVVRELCLLSE